MTSKGTDAVGKFELIHEYGQECGYCFGKVQAVVRYTSTKALEDQKIDPARTIISKPKRRLGVECGCYGKLHRQVAHIMEAMNRRKK